MPQLKKKVKLVKKKVKPMNNKQFEFQIFSILKINILFLIFLKLPQSLSLSQSKTPNNTVFLYEIIQFYNRQPQDYTTKKTIILYFPLLNSNNIFIFSIIVIITMRVICNRVLIIKFYNKAF